MIKNSQHVNSNEMKAKHAVYSFTVSLAGGRAKYFRPFLVQREVHNLKL